MCMIVLTLFNRYNNQMYIITTVYMSKIIYLIPAEYNNNVFNSKSYYTNIILSVSTKYDTHTILYSTNLTQLVVSRLFDLLAYH